jgi:hypothetical protein|tara:strand:+ start:20801 stop:20971 length:171 start_codon:yes stop_codon:yes gene_type:complete
MGGDEKMIKLSFTIIVLWVLLALNWEQFNTTVDKYQLVDKTRELVYNMKEKVINDE